MKRYLILTGGISNMGGAEMYTNNKVKYLIEKGWNVQVFFFNKPNNICLKRLEAFRENYIQEIALPISFYTKKQRAKIIARLSESVSSEDDVVVESQLYGLTLWAELLAKATHGKHIMYCIQEEGPDYSRKLADFFEFKLRKHEIMNGSDKAMKRHFGPYFKSEYLLLSHKSRVYCSNVVSDDVKDTLKLKKADYNIMSVGRLDKPYVKTMLEEVIMFANRYASLIFNFIIIGGSPDGSMESFIKERFEDVSNVNIYLLGYVYPISTHLIRKSDVCIASANSILIGYEQGVPTIAVCANDYQGLGIYGATTYNKISRSEEPVIYIHQLLEEVLIGKKYIRKQPLTTNMDVGSDIFAEQMAFVDSTLNDGQYYDVESIYGRGEKLRDKLKLRLHNILLFLSGASE